MKKRIKKYLPYAFGEILLLVVGILAAFQINQWNEKRKANLLSEEMVGEIREGLESDMEQLDLMMQSQSQILLSQNIISEWLSSGKPYQDSLSNYLAFMYRASDFKPSVAGYETLKQFGLGRIEDKDLRVAISNLYEIRYPEFIKFSEIYQRFLEDLLSKNSKHFRELSYITDINMKPINSARMQADNEFSYSLNSLKNFNQLLILQGNLLQKDLGETHGKFPE